MVTVPCLVTVAAGVFAPGHLGELTRYLPFELVDDVLESTRTTQQRMRSLPSRVVNSVKVPDSDRNRAPAV